MNLIKVTNSFGKKMIINPSNVVFEEQIDGTCKCWFPSDDSVFTLKETMEEIQILIDGIGGRIVEINRKINQNENGN